MVVVVVAVRACGVVVVVVVVVVVGRWGALPVVINAQVGTHDTAHLSLRVVRECRVQRAAAA